MQEPGSLVQLHLREHVHLVSSYKFPYLAHLQLDEAFRFLFDARGITGRLATMSWQYLDSPPDGTLLLEYASSFMQNQYPSDGYVWAEDEEFEVHEYGGYIAKRNAGFRPGTEQRATHARRRFRLVSKNPSVPSQPPDPQIWLIHYGQAEPHHVVPAQQVKTDDTTRRLFNERRWIESHGRLERQEFMLHQREQWPQLQLAAPPKASSPGQTYARRPYAQPPVAHPANPRFSGQYYQQQQAVSGQSPAKRQRQNPPTSAGQGVPPAPLSAVPVQNTSIEDEEDVTYGDLLDQLTQRELSLTRYMQHHEWMEEIFSSPYATGQIVPVNLGFGLVGELSGLTEGIFQVVSTAATANDSNSHKPLQTHDVQEVEKQISEHARKVEAEMKQMQQDHAAAMADMKRSRLLLKAERRLRPALAADGTPVINGHGADIEQIVHEVEQLCGGSIVPSQLHKLVDKGGLKEKALRPPTPMEVVHTEDQQAVAGASVEAAMPDALPSVAVQQPVAQPAALGAMTNEATAIDANTASTQVADQIVQPDVEMSMDQSQSVQVPDTLDTQQDTIPDQVGVGEDQRQPVPNVPSAGTMQTLNASGSVESAVVDTTALDTTAPVTQATDVSAAPGQSMPVPQSIAEVLVNAPDMAPGSNLPAVTAQQAQNDVPSSMLDSTPPSAMPVSDSATRTDAPVGDNAGTADSGTIIEAEEVVSHAAAGNATTGYTVENGDPSLPTEVMQPLPQIPGLSEVPRTEAGNVSTPASDAHFSAPVLEAGEVTLETTE